MDNSAEHRTVIHRHSGWLIPLAFVLALVALSGLFLLWFLRPGPRYGAPGGNDVLVKISMQGLRLAVPANYISAASARGGGEQRMLALAALFPDMRGYSERDADLFAGNAPDSAVIHLLLRSDPNSLDAAERLGRVFMPTIADPKGEAGPFGLTHYILRPDSGYSRNDLFLGETPTGTLLFLCERAQPDLPSPNCVATARPPVKNLSFSWRFKRAFLSDWQRIAIAVDSLMAKLRQDQSR